MSRPIFALGFLELAGCSPAPSSSPAAAADSADCVDDCCRFATQDAACAARPADKDRNRVHAYHCSTRKTEPVFITSTSELCTGIGDAALNYYCCRPR